MQIDQTSSTTQSDSANTTTTKKEDALGRDAFLNLLVTQLQHQDPTQPMADGEFLAQLAQFSSLEQLQQMNQSLTQIAQFYAALGGVATDTDSTSSPSTEGKA